MKNVDKIAIFEVKPSEQDSKFIFLSGILISIAYFLFLYTLIAGGIEKVLRINASNLIGWVYVGIGIFALIAVPIIYMITLHHNKHTTSSIILYQNYICYPTTSLERRIFKKNKFISIHDIEKILCKGYKWSHYLWEKKPKEFIIITKDGKRYNSFARHPNDVDKFVEIIKERWPNIQIEELKK